MGYWYGTSISIFLTSTKVEWGTNWKGRLGDQGRWSKDVGGGEVAGLESEMDVGLELELEVLKELCRDESVVDWHLFPLFPLSSTTRYPRRGIFIRPPLNPLTFTPKLYIHHVQIFKPIRWYLKSIFTISVLTYFIGLTYFWWKPLITFLFLHSKLLLISQF